MRKFFLVIVWICIYTFRVNAQPGIDSSITPETADTSSVAASLLKQKDDSAENKYENVLKRMLNQNKFINFSMSPVYLVNKEKENKDKDALFYILSVVLLMLGILKVFYSKYFYNIFRVFFNTSLRQNQLTDLLLQAKLPSLIFNTFFVITAGLYIWTLLNYYQWLRASNNYIILSACILATGFVYIGKYFSLKFIGWVSGMSLQSDTYIFITFLINKILGIILLPFTIIMIFGTDAWVNTAAMVSLFIIAILFILRYFRSYGLLQSQLRINWFQFLIYIAAAEIIPILVFCKAAANLLT